MQTSVFLTAEWRHLVMVNYLVDPELLHPLVPQGTELDFFDNRTFLSVVGFRFIHTRVLGIPIPLHSDFEEVNLRFYVRRNTAAGWRRGVVFIRELVPRQAIAFIARTFYREPYTALPMKHSIVKSDFGIQVEYAWRRAGRWESLRAVGEGELLDIERGSEAEFITEHYWGYTAHHRGYSEYQVEHPRWRAWRGVESRLDVDISSLYGGRFVESLSAPPCSMFIVDGSPIVVRFKSPPDRNPAEHPTL